MLELTNKRTTYSVENVKDNITLVGEITINDKDEVISFNGLFKVDNIYSGSCFFSIGDNNKVSKNLTDLDVDIQLLANQLLDITIEEFKNNNK